jgi:hypothetical protein
MISNAGSKRGGREGFRRALTLSFALLLGLGVAGVQQSALARVSDAAPVPKTTLPSTMPAGDQLRSTAAPDGRILVAGENIRVGKGKGNQNWNSNNKNWNKNWNSNNKNWNKNWNSNNKNWNKNWSKNNNWNNNWNRRAYVRGWSRRPYYGEFFAGVVLGSILTAGAAGLVPPAPAPNVCWYWADPYMYRGYWDYCY